MKENAPEYKQSIVKWARVFSQTTWDRIAFCRRLELGISETTITEELVFRFWKNVNNHHWPAEVYKSVNEKVNGSDLEVFIETDKGYVLFPVQAKIIKEGGAYRSINYKRKGVEQIDRLTSYAEMKKGIPLYLLYNYVNEKGSDWKDFGCSFTHANFIARNYRGEANGNVGNYDWVIPTFSDLHPTNAFKFHVLFDRFIYGDIRHGIHAAPFHFNSEYRFYTSQEIQSDNLWTNISPFGRISGIGEPMRMYAPVIPTLDPTVEFNPQFRLIISLEIQQSGIYRVS